MEETNKTNQLQEFEINKLVVETYNKIASWHNEEANDKALKLLSLELIEDIAGAAFKHLGLNYTPGFVMSEEERNKFNLEKEKENKKSVNEMTDEELMLEIRKRKKV